MCACVCVRTRMWQRFYLLGFSLEFAFLTLLNDVLNVMARTVNCLVNKRLPLCLGPTFCIGVKLFCSCSLQKSSAPSEYPPAFWGQSLAKSDMRLRFNSVGWLLCLFISTTGCQCTASGIATYEFKFTSTWSSPTPPTSFPHWSSPVGTSHSPCYTMWRPGSTASTGIEQMAEFGGTGSLTTEFSSNSKCLYV